MSQMLIRMRLILLFLLVCLSATYASSQIRLRIVSSQGAFYTLPADRSISWYPAGMDIVSGIPTYTDISCGTVTTADSNAAPELNACITAAAANSRIVIPDGVYNFTQNISMKSNVCVVGESALPAGGPYLPTADSTVTTFSFTAGAQVVFDGGTKAANWGSNISITSGYTQHSASLTFASEGAISTIAVNDYISIYQAEDSAIMDDKDFDWLGEDSGTTDMHTKQQYSKVTAKNGVVLTIDPPVYYVTPNATGATIREQDFNISGACLENLRLQFDGNTNNNIFMRFVRNSWIRGVESYLSGSSSTGSAHVFMQFSYGNEFSGNYWHTGADHDSGASYGYEFYHWNSRHKIVDSIVRDVRHSICLEGGTSGSVFVYNYTDANWESVEGMPTTPATDQLSEDVCANHGAHPHMNLWEGNSFTNWMTDYTQGSSSHQTLFRNWIRCTRTTPALTDPWLHVCVDIHLYNSYMNLVGNIVGQSTFSSGTVLSTTGMDWGVPTMFRYGCDSVDCSGHDATLSFNTVLRQGDYNYVSDTITQWDNTNHTLPNSLYYAAKPSFFGSCSWPWITSTGPTIGTLPSKERYDGSSC